jgi:hypothetical protein
MSRSALDRIYLGVALALPLAVSAYTWATTYRLAHQGQDWLIPIKGYDPRDLLRGHFIQYRYDWPIDEPPSKRQTEPALIFNPSYSNGLCIEGVAPNITRVRVNSGAPQPAGPANEHCAIIVRATLGSRRDVRGLESGIIFTSQARALTLSRQLADPKQQGLIHVKIRPDGVIRPVDIQFRPRITR